ncbi:tetratricopeptide repeat protein [Moritella marina ATCC 15381]|uniref:Tetratricopeptide repeat protein n=1 Tax=Moritella marina ATCC 15381 TaxID=1202962 RepID=A0A5J6WGL5_MORMI|nr:tetratricopeptide repeat protein [Moritella marina]QFI37176.1 tetratricopeptide repeat protein [Moritella marina ATCC 15381]
MKIIKRLCLLLLPWLLTACGTIPTYNSNGTEVQGSTNTSKAEQSKPTPAVKAKQAAVDETAQAPAAVLSLMKRAEEQVARGDNPGAIASLERAIRIAPRYPETYYRLGERYFNQGNYKQARSLAEKSITLGADWLLRRQAESLMERASAYQ